MILSGCATDLVGTKGDIETVSFPTGMVVHPNGKYAYVVGSNFDLDYRATDGGVLYVVDLENNAVMPTSKRIGSFGTNVVLSGNEPGKPTRGYLVTRDDDALVWFEVSEDGSDIYCPKNREASDLLDCRIIIEDDPTFVTVTRSYREQYDSNGNPNGRLYFDLLMIAQLRNSYVTAMTVIPPASAGKDYKFSYETASLVYSASEVLWARGEQFFVTGRAATDLALIEPVLSAGAKVLGLHVKERFTVPEAMGAYDGRGMTTDPAHQHLYLINQYPNSIYKFNIGNTVGGDVKIENTQAVGIGLLSQNMSKIAWVGDQENGVLYLSSVTDNSIYLVDPISLEIILKLEVGEGPYDIQADNDKNEVYVLHFNGNDIWLFDTSDPRHPVVKKKFLNTEDDAT